MPAAGAHPAGWGVQASPAFHAKWLSANSFPLPRCQQCHGDDYLGGSVGFSCVQSGCHTKPPIACTTCHGSFNTPRPNQGAHWAHEAYCDTCHIVPAETTASVQHHASGDAATLISFSGLALQNPSPWQLDAGAGDASTWDASSPPSWDPTALQCTNTYCHGAVSPKWTTSTQIACSGCHGAPPPNHARWIRVAASADSCVTCHPSPDGPTHMNGVVDVTVTSCTTCHGEDGHPNPPMGLDGSTDPSTLSVGAHDRHLNGALPDRISEPLVCNDCHDEPTTVLQPGHLDQSVTQVRFPFGGAFDATTASCNVWCHFNKPVGGPVWNNNTGSARQCNSCHAFPPVTMRDGAPHPSVPGELSACLRCHPFGPTTHVDGVVEFLGQ